METETVLSDTDEPSTLSARFGVFATRSEDSPRYAPTMWEPVNGLANCFAYALDDPFGVGRKCPGELSGAFDWATVRPDRLDDRAYANIVSDAARKDGLIEIEDPTKPHPGYSLVAMLVKDGPEHDFHWVRYDANGGWSHKEGNQAPTNLDSTGEVIKDPRTCKIEGYNRFNGFYLVPPRR